MSRSKKKAIKNSLIIYDVNSCPDSMGLDDVIYHFNNSGILIYTSRNRCIKPQIVGRKKKSLHIGDVSKEPHLKRKYER